MDVTGSRIDKIPTLVSKEDQQKLSKCDKQMKVQCNENFQRPSWLKGNTKSSSWPVPKIEKDYSCADKENFDPRQPCKNIFNTQNQKKKDGFDIEEVVGESDEEMSPIALSKDNESPSPRDGINGTLTSGSPMVMSSLFSGRIVFDISSELKLLNDDNGASPMFIPRNQLNNVNQIDSSIYSDRHTVEKRTSSCSSSVLTQTWENQNYRQGNTGESEGFERGAPMNIQRQTRLICRTLSNTDLLNGLSSPVSRSNSSGFKRPFGRRDSNKLNTSSENIASYLVDQDNDMIVDSLAKPFIDSSQDQNVKDCPSKRKRWDSNEWQPKLLKSHSMSALSCNSSLTSTQEEGSNSNQFLCKVRRDPTVKKSRLSRSKSFMDPSTAAQIMEACSIAEFDPNRTGDTKHQLSLPVTQGHSRNSDLKNIACETMAKLLSGQYNERISRCRIIDARYCYEFEGGHIRGAENYGSWDEDAFLAEFFPPSLQAKTLSPKQKMTTKDQDEGGGEKENKENEKRDILVFHCEFSSARGPALMRMLRKKDREINKATYPALHYPECYLLHDGYKAFYEAYPDLCDGSYLPMKHPSFVSEERKFHKKSKSWAAGGGATVSRTGASSRLLKL